MIFSSILSFSSDIFSKIIVVPSVRFNEKMFMHG
jgi:hypothetical protein